MVLSSQSSGFPPSREGTFKFKEAIRWKRPDGAEAAFAITVYVINNGVGPGVLLSGGVHGDEFEGPLALRRFLHDLDPNEISGTLFVIPDMNPPALNMRQRRSLADEQDLNRSFPGKIGGEPTAHIAHFVSTQILPHVDFVLDLHAGGNSGIIAPSVMTHFLECDELFEKTLRAIEATNAPIALVINELDPAGMLDVEAVRQGKVFGCAELGGAGMTTNESVERTLSIIRNFLRYARVSPGECEPVFWRGETQQRWLCVKERDRHVLAPKAGLFDSIVEVGDVVEADDLLGCFFPSSDDALTSVKIVAPYAGFIYERAAGGTVMAGDVLAVIGEPMPGALRASGAGKIKIVDQSLKR